MLSALARLTILVHHQIVVQNVLLTQSVPKTSLAIIKNVLIHVLVHVVLTPDAKLLITMPFVVVIMVLVAIHLFAV
jgi:hypothetical protein